MKNLLKTSILSAGLLFLSIAAYSASDSKEKDGKSKGYVTGSLESNTIRYSKDEAIPNSVNPEDKIGSNNYVKLDYHSGRFSAGVQLESYLPVQQNYPKELDGTKLTNFYIDWSDDNFSVTAGTFYDQFGSGLLFRSWEDRPLGLNNALLGARFTYNFRDIVKAKILLGKPRLGMDFADTQVRGGDLQFNISQLAGWDQTYLSVEGSVLNRYEAVSSTVEDAGGSPNRTGYSGRVNFDINGFFLRAEYVDAGNKYYTNPNYSSENPNLWVTKHGNAQLVELGYNGNGLGVNLTARRLEWMDSQITMTGNSVASIANMMNYVPALCTQYTYLLTTLHPYSPQTGKTTGVMNSGEMGGQLDVFYNFKRRSAIGGKYGMKVHANFSTYYSIMTPGTFKARNMLYRDLSVDIEKKFTNKFKAIVLWSMQEKNQSYGDNATTHIQNIFVADMLYKFTPKFSTRLELQYLQTFEDEKDWMAALAEVSFAPSWSFWVSDMYNHGSTKKHYYNVGLSYAKSRTRVAVGYGRFKEGYLCSGGVCRPISAYTGANFTITTSF